MSDFLRRHAPAVVGVIILGAFLVSAYAFFFATEKRRSACIDLEAVKTIIRHEKQQANIRAIGYLRRHPHGAPGIPRALIIQSIRTQKKLIQQLAPKNC